MSPHVKQQKALQQEPVISNQPKGPILRMPALASHIGLSPSMVYELQNSNSPYYDPAFPAAVRLSGKAVGWFAGEVNAWLESRPRVRAAANDDHIVSSNFNAEGEVARG